MAEAFLKDQKKLITMCSSAFTWGVWNRIMYMQAFLLLLVNEGVEKIEEIDLR